MNRFPFFAAVLAGGLAIGGALRADEVLMASRPIVTALKGDLTLERAVEIALRQNPNILKAIQEIERTRGQIIEVRAQALPRVTLLANYDQRARSLFDVGGGGNGGDSSAADIADLLNELAGASGNGTGGGTGTGGTGNGGTGGGGGGGFSFGGNGGGSNPEIQNISWSVRLEARQLLYAGGQVRAALNIARFTEDSAYWQLRDVIDQTIAQTRIQFYDILTNRALINVAEETVKLQQDFLTDQKNRFEAGTVPRFNVLRAEVELANVVPTLIRARNDFITAQTELSRTLGLNPGPGGRPEFNAVGSLGIAHRRFELEDALGVARARRPFLKVQRQQILIQKENIKVELAGYKPRLEASGGWEWRNSSRSTELDRIIDGWFFGLTGSWNIFDGFETAGRVKQARALLETSRINYGDSVRQVELEVQQAYLNLEAARQTIESQQKNVEQAVEALRLANERLSAGAGTQLEVLDARVALTRARTTELQARSDYNKALAEFDRATATTSVYIESFRDPLGKIEEKIFGKRLEAVEKVQTRPSTERKSSGRKEASRSSDGKKVAPAKGRSTPTPPARKRK